MKEWLKVKEFAELEDISERAVRLRKERGQIKAFRYIESAQGGRGGKELEIHSSELSRKSVDSPESEPAPSNTGALAVIPNTETSSNLPVTSAGSLPPEQGHGIVPALPQTSISDEDRKTALARLDLIRAWEGYRSSHPGLTADIDREFQQGYNSGVIYQSLHTILGNVSVKTLYRWKSQLDGSTDWKRLVPQYGKAAQAQRLNEIEEKVFQAFILSPNKIKIGTAIRLTRFALERRGYRSDKCDMTFRRYAEDFKAKYYDKWILLREGQKALRDKVEPYIKRDPSVLNVGDALVADGHKLNFQVINPFTGRPCRATMIAYIDWKSYDLAGYEIMINENTQCIASAMRNSIVRLGRMPLVSYQDNGKAFRAQFFTGIDNLEESGLYGLFGRLNIVPVFAKPYNARAKIVERWFKEFSDTFERLFPSFIGSSIADKPAYMLRNEKLHKALHNEYVPTIEEAVMLLECWLEFHRSQECPHVKGKTIGEVFNEGRGDGVDIAELDDLMMDFKITRLDRNGVRFLGQHYYDENLTGLREHVIIRYSLFDLSHIKVYAMSGEHICTANRVMPVHPLAAHLGTPKDVEELKRNLSMQKRAEKKTIQGSKELMKLGKTAELDWQKVIEISPRIADRLEAENIQTPAIEEHIPEEAVQTVSIAGDSPESTALPVIQGQSPTRLEPSSRPFFESNIDRYEWHLQYGVWTDGDEAWCLWFRTTDEFRMLYSAFQKEAGQ